MPPKGTAGLARSAVRGISLLPSPPARTIARTLGAIPRTLNAFLAPRQMNVYSAPMTAPRVDLLTREFPPDVYGGAGVHVEYLARDLVRLADVWVHCFGADRPSPPGMTVRAYPDPPQLSGANPALRTMGVDLAMAAGCAGTSLVHSHTWYANLAGHTAKLLHGVPHVVTTHSLEPLRPWKAEQLGGGYALSSWCERTALEAADAVIAVSDGMRRDVLSAYPSVDPTRVHVVHNGIDTAQYAPSADTDVVSRLGISADRPSVVFVGRITRQKGLPYLLRACACCRPRCRWCCSSARPTRPRSRRRYTGSSASSNRGAPGWSGSGKCSPSGRSSRS